MITLFKNFIRHFQGISKASLKWVVGSFIIIFFIAHTLNMFTVSPLNKLEGIASDYRLNSTLQFGVDERIIIADIDEASLLEFGHWPWNRHILADLVNTLYDHYEINVLGFDMVFAEAKGQEFNDLYESAQTSKALSNKNKQLIQHHAHQDHDFANSLKGRNLVSGIFFNKGLHEHAASKLNDLPNPIAQLELATHEKMLLPKPHGYTANIPILQQASKHAGFFDNPIVDKDGVFRRVPLLQSFNGALYPSLALSVAKQALSDSTQKNNHEAGPVLDIQLLDINDSLVIESVQLGHRLIKTDSQGAVYIPFRGPEGSFPYISVKEILLKKTPKQELQNKIILLGTSAAGLLDLRATPVDESMAGVEVHANIIAGILDESIPQEPPYLIGAMVLVYLIMGLLLLILPHFLSPLFSLFLCAFLAVAWYQGNFYMWHTGLIFPLAMPLFMILCFFIFHTFWGFFVESKKKRAITKLFGQYVPPQLVEEMAKQPDEISLAGENKHLSVLFADVRNFTTISESLSPTELTQLMNSILTPMTEAIYQELGTVDKYMGDAIMAFWGAPLPQEDHCQRAVMTALNMQQKITKLNRQLEQDGKAHIGIGIGINSGPMNVGNMGSEYRMAYTVMGDAVNLGSRLEGLSKVYGAKVVVSESTKIHTHGLLYRPLDKVRVKGKTEPIAIYEPLMLNSEASEQEKKAALLCEQAFEFYQQQKWQQSLDNWSQLEALFTDPSNTGSDDDNLQRYLVLITLYRSRIKAYEQEPPAADWDGAYTFTSK